MSRAEDEGAKCPFCAPNELCALHIDMLAQLQDRVAALEGTLRDLAYMQRPSDLMRQIAHRALSER